MTVGFICRTNIYRLNEIERRYLESSCGLGWKDSSDVNRKDKNKCAIKIEMQINDPL